VKGIPEKLRKITTVLLAVFLWLHALFLLNLHWIIISKIAQFLQLNFSEVLLICLLVLFSLLTASGFWRTLRSLAYIYFFPFVLIGYGFVLIFRGLVAFHKWVKARAGLQGTTALIIQKPVVPATPISGPTTTQKTSPRGPVVIPDFLLRPFRSFMLIWCLLLLVTTHEQIVWACLLVVLVQLARKVLVILTALFFPAPWLRKIGTPLLQGLVSVVDKIANMTLDAPAQELQNLLNQFRLCRSVLDFLQNSYLLTRWAWLIGGVVIGTLYIYVSLLFSFAYYGIARVSHVSYAWRDAFLASLFIPFFITELPKLFWARLLGGAHCLLVVTISVGTIVNFLRNKLEALRVAAAGYSQRFADDNVQAKYIILEQRFAPEVKKQ